MGVDMLATIGALVQQQNQNIIRLQHAVERRRERRRRDRVVWVRQWILRRPSSRKAFKTSGSTNSIGV